MNTREVVENYYQALCENRFQDLEQYKTAYAKYWICGEGSWPYGGFQSDEGMQKIMANITAKFPDGIQIKVKSIVADTHSATVHLENYGVRVDGRIYNNQILMLITTENGLINTQAEFLDTILANELLCGPLTDSN